MTMKFKHIWNILLLILISFSVQSQCNTNTTICTPGVAGPFNFIPASSNPSSCLDFTNGQAAPNYAYIILYITQGGDLNLLIEGDQATGYLDVSIFDITGETDPCGSLSTATEIGCSYALFQDGCNQFGTTFPCTSSAAAPTVNAGDVVMILVEDWDDVMTNFTLELSTAPGSAETGLPDATINTPPTVCATGSPIQLTAANMGGTWSGPGISPDGVFDPTVVGVGTYNIDYVIGNVPCQSTDQATIEVIDCTVPTPCPFYDNTPIAEYKACGEQLYDFTVLNTACPAVVCFDVVGNYGSSFAGEITWEVLSVLTGNVVASGGPGTNGGNIFVSVCFDPNVEGTVYNLIVYDSFGDGFNGAGGYIQIDDNGSTIAGPISGNFGAETNQVFASNIDISPTTLTINTPSGPFVNTIGNCADHNVQFTLNNTNYCTPISVDMPWEIVCDQTGSVLSSGIHSVVIYPQIATTSSDVVDITWNSTTCQWDIDPQNDCELLDIGSTFIITPDPSAWPANTCAPGSQDFSVEYIGLQGSPDCCSTGGALGPITYNTTTTAGDAVVSSSPYGGVNNAAYTTIPPNGDGGLSTDFNLTITGTNFCYNPPSTSTDYNYYIAVWVDGVQVILDGPNCCNNSNFSVTVTEADLAAAGVVYDENSTIDIYILPNNFWVDPCPIFPCPVYTTFNPNATCGSLADGEWTMNDLTITFDATYTEQTQTAANCTLVTQSPYTCCVIDLPTASNPTPIDVQCTADVPAPDPVVVTTESSPCNPVVTWISDISDNNSCPEVITRTYRVTDDCGNSIDVEQTITINDTQNPTASDPTTSSYECLSDVPIANSAVITDEADNCSTPTVAFVSESQSGTCPIIISRIYSVTDDCGNSIDVTHTISVEDNTAPVLDPAPMDVTVECIGDVPAMTDLDWTDNCDGTGTVTGSDGALSGGACGGTITRTWTYTDACGNVATTTQTITIDDTTLPTASDPIAIDVPTGPAPAPDPLVVTDEADNCTINPIVAWVSDLSDGGACPETITRTYSVTDDCGNQILVEQIITISSTGLTLDDSNVSILDELCNGTMGSISGIVVSGTGSISYDWDNSPQNSADITGLSAGSYTLTATDDVTGCSIQSGPYIVQYVDGPTVDESNLTISNENCDSQNGSILGITADGTPVIDYAWSNAGGNNVDATNLSAGSYTLTITDGNGCTVTSGPHDVLNIGGPTIDISELIITDQMCNGTYGTISGITASGTGSLSYSWTNSTSTSIDLVNLTAGSYILTVTEDLTGCASQEGPFVVNYVGGPNAAFTYQPNLVYVPDSISFTDQSTGNIVNWSWNIEGDNYSEENPSHYFTAPGDYVISLTVVDANGCTDEVSVTIQVLNRLSIPNIITRNSDGVNDWFEITGLLPNSYLLILNRWGNVIFESSNYDNKWAGENKSGAKVAEGVYSYVLKSPDGNQYHGFVHIVDNE